MADGTKIEWTEATWNPITGCSVVSKGCTNCYAMRLAGTRLKNHPSRAGLTRDTKAGPVWTGKVRFNEQWLDQPLRWSRPRMIFVCAHGDLFAEGVPDEWLDRIFAVMALAPQHTFQVLTKRPERACNYLHDERTPGRIARRILDLWIAGEKHARAAMADDRWPVRSIGDIDDPDDVAVDLPLPNVWLGVSAEDQRRADERIPILLDTPAAVRWISAEPLLGPVDLSFIRQPNMGGGPWWFDALDRERAGWFGDEAATIPTFEPWAADHFPRLDWVVSGGESGPGARPMHPDWVRSLRDQCAAAGVPYFHKQNGIYEDCGPAWGCASGSADDLAGCVFLDSEGTVHRAREASSFGAVALAKVGKKAAGRLLDGRTHDAMPESGR